MLNKNEIKILEKLIECISREFTIADISKELGQKYSQAYKSIKILKDKGIVKARDIGKSKVISLDFSGYHPEYAISEMERLNHALKSNDIKMVFKQVLDINGQFICILFGSYARKNQTKKSDLDILFIIPDEYDAHQFERKAKNKLAVYRADINVINTESLFEMWSSPKKLNVGNEILKNHIILQGSDLFWNLMRKKNVGR